MRVVNISGMFPGCRTSQNKSLAEAATVGISH